MNSLKRLIIVLLTVIIGQSASSQTTIRLDTAIASALRTHPKIQMAEQDISQQRALKKGSFNFQNPDLWLESPTATEFAVGVQQTIQNPVVYIQQSKVGSQTISLSEKGLRVNQTSLVRDTRVSYLNLQYAEIKVAQLKYQDSIFNGLYLAAERRYNAGDADLLEKISADARSKQVGNTLTQAKADLLNAQAQLKILTGIEKTDIVSEAGLSKNKDGLKIISDTSSISSNPMLDYYKQNIALSEQALKLEKSKLLPGLMFGVLNQGYSNTPTIYRLRFGITLPLWFWTYSSQIKAANIRTEMASSQFSLINKSLTSNYQQAIADFKKYGGSLNYFEATALKQAETIISAATRSYGAGEINYLMYMQSLNQAFEIKMNYYEAVRNYNESIIQLNYLNGQL
jgi:cobalt-zinc-cadmium efflux system outer membrane protein